MVGFALEPAARRAGWLEVGDLGGGIGRFAGPMALTTGRAGGASTLRRLRRRRRAQSPSSTCASTAAATLPVDRRGAHRRRRADARSTHDQWATSTPRPPIRAWSRSSRPRSELAPDSRAGSMHRRASTFRSSPCADHRDGSVTARRPAERRLDRALDRTAAACACGSSASRSRASRSRPGARRRCASRCTDAATREPLRWWTAATAACSAAARRRALDAGEHAVVARGARNRSPERGRGHVVLKVAASSRYANGTFDVAQTSFRIKGGTVSPPSRPMPLAHARQLPGGRLDARSRSVLPERPSGSVSLRRVLTRAGSQGAELRLVLPPGRNEILVGRHRRPRPARAARGSTCTASGVGDPTSAAG